MINAFSEMTIFNAFTGPDRREFYFPTRIGGITWYENSTISGSEGFKKNQDAYSIRVPIAASVQDQRTFLPPDEFRRLSLRELPKHWTIQEGDYIFPKLFYPSKWRWDDFSFRTGIISEEWNEFEGSICYGKNWKWDDFSFRYGRIKPNARSDVGMVLEQKYRKVIKVSGYADNTKRGGSHVRHWRINGG